MIQGIKAAEEIPRSRLKKKSTASSVASFDVSSRKLASGIAETTKINIVRAPPAH